MEDLQTDLDRLEDALRALFQHLKRPSTWQSLTTQAGVQIDRPSAGLIHTLAQHQKAPCKLNDIADMLGIEAPSVTRKAQELVRLGLVKRWQSETDRRSVYLELTEKGLEIEKRIKQARRESSEQVLKNWTKSERQQFVSLFESYTKGLSEQDNRHLKLNSDRS